jgi:hypothetical protein
MRWGESSNYCYALLYTGLAPPFSVLWLLAPHWNFQMI